MARSDSGNRISIQTRDLLILNELVESRVVTTNHLAHMFFDSKLPAAYKRIGLLKSAGLITQTRKRSITQPAILQIKRSGFNCLSERMVVDITWKNVERHNRISDSLLLHELALVDTKVAFVSQMQGVDNLHLVSFKTLETHLPNYSTTYLEREKCLRPDAYIHISNDSTDTHFFLEIDQSTQSHRVIQEKAIAYRSYYKSGRFASRKHRKSSPPESAPFRVLFVCRTKERRDNLAASLLDIEPPVLKQCWFASIDDVTANVLGDIWITPYEIKETRNKKRGLINSRLFPDNCDKK